MKTAVVILNWNTREYLEKFLPGLIAGTDASIVVADNASTDGSLQFVRERFPELDLRYVRGNCDVGMRDEPEKLSLHLEGVEIFATHGHLYNVRYNLASLAYAAMEQGAQIAMYGHTHQAEHSEMGGVKLLNPGTAGKGRERTFAVVDIFENGGIACEIREI